MAISMAFSGIAFAQGANHIFAGYADMGQYCLIGEYCEVGEHLQVQNNIWTETGHISLNTNGRRLQMAGPSGQMFSVIRMGTAGVDRLATSAGPQQHLLISNDNGSGDIRFATTGGGQGVNSENNRFTIASGGNVGVNTTTPSFRLEVIGTIGASVLPVDNSAEKFVVWDDATNQFKYRSSSSVVSNFNLSCATTNFVPKLNASGDLTCSSIQDDGSTVGINGISNFYNLDPLALYVNGSVHIVGSTYNTSDFRYKKDVRTIGESSLDLIASLRGVKYSYRTEEFPNHNFTKGETYGVIAQEIEEVMPELVITDDNGYKAVNYQGIIPVLIEAIKEQQAEIEDLRALVNTRSTSMGANEIDKQNIKILSIYPNPTEGIVKLNYTQEVRASQNVQVLITNLQGAMLKSRAFESGLPADSGEVEVDCSDLSDGIYIYNFIVDGRVITSEKFVVKK
ncbi:tail fiber domain-containing protein [Owenweeksia hongkongensis]|uniref:tail fiber domain-containing protein n=1 Tax=Owenweeksia hongkongensis TaxID=253245 RepID=UPI003A91B686